MSRADERRGLILAIVGSEVVRTQDDLVDALAARGHRASQASVSRDVAALGLVKRGGRYVAPGSEPPPDDPLRVRIRENLLAIRTAGPHLVVLNTAPGGASGLALAVDRLLLPGFVGSVAGDDTILVAVTGAAGAKDFVRALREV